MRQKFQQVYEGHVQNGKTLQLIAINAHTDHRPPIDCVDEWYLLFLFLFFFFFLLLLLLLLLGGSLFEGKATLLFWGWRGIDFCVGGWHLFVLGIMMEMRCLCQKFRNKPNASPSEILTCNQQKTTDLRLPKVWNSWIKADSAKIPTFPIKT